MTEAPTRPPIPPVLWFALAMWAGCVAGEQAAWSAGEGAPALLSGVLPLAAVTIAAGAFVARTRNARAALPGWMVAGAIVIAGVAAGAVVSGAYGAAWWRLAVDAGDAGARQWTGVVEADPLPGTFGTRVRVRITGGPVDGARVLVRWPAEAPVPELGRTVCFSAILKRLPEDEPWARRVARGGAVATANAWRAECGGWRGGIQGRLLQWRAARLASMRDIPGTGGDLVEGVVLGDRRRLMGTAAESDFQVLGLTHLVAVSGSHLALACAAVAAFGRLLRFGRRPLVIATVSAGAAYAVVTGLPYSALRSLLMLVAAGAATLSGRRGDGPAALAVAVIGVLTIEPWSVFDIGFQLSALAVGGLLLFGDLVVAWGGAGLTGVARLGGGTLALTYLAQLITTPVVAATFGMLSLAAPLANAIAAPLMTAALWAGLTGAVTGAVVPAVGRLFTDGAAAVLAVTAEIAAVMARAPGASVPVSAGFWTMVAPYAVCVLLWVAWPLPTTVRAARGVSIAVVMMTVALAIGPAPPHGASVVVLDVGQGDAILVRDGGRTMLVDTGPDPTTLRRALARHGVRRVDVLVLTHAHDDHTGGVTGLEGVCEVGWVGVPLIADATDPADVWRRHGSRAGTRKDRPPRELEAGDSWKLGRTTVIVLWPPSGGVEGMETNDTSVVLQVTRGEFDCVLTGDAEEAVWSALEASSALVDIETLKVPHHGSRNGLTASALDRWRPELALISVGTGNSFGHPASSTMALLGEAGSGVWRTDRHGDLVVEIGVAGARVRSQR